MHTHHSINIHNVICQVKEKMGVHPGFLHSRCLNFGLRDMGMGCD